LQPQRSRTLGLRLVISAVIFTGVDTLSLEGYWKAYRGSLTQQTSPAAISMAPPATQTSLQLVEATDIVRKLVHEPTLTEDMRRQLEILQSSFGNIEATIKRADVDSASAWIEIAVTRALYIARVLKHIPVSANNLERAKRLGLDAKIIMDLEKNIDNLQKDIDDKLKDYTESIHQLDRHEKDSIEQAIERYLIYLKRIDDKDGFYILDKAVREHYNQYSKDKKADIPRWKTELAEY
jgi:hypothetical protein